MDTNLHPMPEPATSLPVVARAVTEEIEAYLHQRMDALGLPPVLDAAVRHGLLTGGKRLRPILTLLSAEAAGGSREAALPAAAAVEMIHAFSLIHDDLPALDNDDLRRGQPTVHVAHGEPAAILAGDTLMSAAFQILAGRCDDPALSGRLVSELAAGTTAMIVGQVHDTLGGLPDWMSDDARVRAIHENKTGALIRAACRMGALSARPGAGEDDASLVALTRYADAIGLMFQIVDDLLDIEQSAEHVGKRTAKDEEAGKLTFPGVHGASAARREIGRLLGVARESTGSLGPSATPLAEVAEYLATRTR
jgi:geranylgeranyl pyrophosphate synthase